MSWDERQHRLLQAMGLRLWNAPQRGPAETETEAETGVATAAGMATAAARPAASGARAGQAEATLRPARRPTPAVPAAPVAVALAAPIVAAPALMAGLDWGALQAAVAGCQACGLCSSRKQTVFGAGHTRAHWLIVGEAPGAEEDASGQPFVGPSGQLLDAMLAPLGLSRAADGDPAQRVYIANTLKCRPPSNRNPAPAELQSCLPFLHRQIELLQPRIVLAMGKFAVQALLGLDQPLGRLRGQIHRNGERLVVVTYHPSYLLRSPAKKAEAWADLCLAADAAQQAA